MAAERCVFCQRIAGGDIARSVGTAVAFPDAFPLADGHTLVCPRRHVALVSGLTDSEWVDLWSLVREAQRDLTRERRVAGWNIGVNDGPAAGQTVPHAHVHLIPRVKGDVDDPRGGIRWVLPARAAYWPTRG